MVSGPGELTPEVGLAGVPVAQCSGPDPMVQHVLTGSH